MIRLLAWLTGRTYNPMDLETHPPGWIPCHGYTTRSGRCLLGFALRGAPVDNPDLDPSRLILGRRER